MSMKKTDIKEMSFLATVEHFIDTVKPGYLKLHGTLKI